MEKFLLSEILDSELDQFSEGRSWCSQLFFLWIFRYIRLGFSKNLSGPDDIPKLQPELCSRTLSNSAIGLWDQQNNPSVLRVAWKMHCKPLCIGIFLGVVQGIFNNALRPILLNYIIIALDPNTRWTSREVYQLFLLFVVVVFLEGWTKVNSLQIISVEAGNQCASWILALLQRKATKLRRYVNVSDSNWDCKNTKKNNNDKDPTNSELEADEGDHVANDVTLIGNDLLTQLEKMKWMAYFPQLIAGFISGVVALVWLLGTPSFLGLATMFFIFWICDRLSNIGKIVTKRDLEAADARQAMMRAIITNILPLKYVGWEESYFDQIVEKRKLELKEVLSWRQIMVYSVTLGRVSPVLASLVTFTFMGLHNSYHLTPSAVFSSLAAFNALRMPLIALPLICQYWKDMIVSTRRFEEYLAQPEHVDLPRTKSPEVAVSIRAADLSWQLQSGKEDMNSSLRSSEWFCLRNINLKVERGELVAIAGRVGTGKTTLLSSMIGDAIIIKGTVEVAKGNLGYVSQKPFVLSGTLLENILMGREKNNKELHRVIEDSGMTEDITLMPNKLNTEVGEGGTTLSGGQQMRLSIARAIYGDPDLLLIDDCLAAVDGRVARNIFLKVFEGRQKRAKTTIVVLNQVYLLKKDCWSRIVFLNDKKGGEVMMGTFADLVRKSSSFCTMVLSVSLSEGNIFDNLRRTTFSKKATKNDMGNKTKLPPAPEDVCTGATGENLFKDDVRQTGSIDWVNLYPFFVGMGGIRNLLITCIMGVIAYGLMGATDLWLAVWVTNIESMPTVKRCIGYAGFSLGHAVFIMTLSLWNAKSCNKAGADIHRNCVSKILHAPSSWHEETPSGRIMSRFSGDLSMVDHIFAYALDDLIQFTFLQVNLYVVIMILIPEMTIIIIPSIWLFSLSIVAVDQSNRWAKRNVNLSISPLMTNIVETTSARQLIISMGFGPFFCQRQKRNIHCFLRVNHLSFSTINWGFLISNYIGVVFTIGTLLFVYFRNYKDIAKIGISLNYCAVVPYFLSIYGVQFVTFGNGLTCLERVLQYGAEWLPQEPRWRLPSDPPTSEWPCPKSAILPFPTLSFQDVSLSYRQGLPLVVKNVTFEVKQGEHIGIVGKTGAGKSSLIALLFRIVELNSGKIFLFGKDTATFGVRTLRDAIGIITQQPLLLPGTLAYNLDPFNDYSRGHLMRTVEKVGLSSSYLDRSVTTLSGGEQQLMALARLILRCDATAGCPALIVLDEPTANIDAETDKQIQNVLAEQFQDIPTLTIAHRLETIISSDRILVMDKG